MLIKLLTFGTFSIALFLNIRTFQRLDSFLRPQVKDYSVGLKLDPEIGNSSIYGAQLSRLLPEDGNRVQSPKHCLQIKSRTMDNVQKVNNFMNMPVVCVRA
jgi:hypothetical protein